MTTLPDASAPCTRRVRLGYVVSHPIQYQAPLLARIAREPDIDLTVLFGSDFSIRAYRDEGFGVDVAWDTPLVEGYKHEFLPPLRDTRTVSFSSPISRGLIGRMRSQNNQPAFDALWVHGYASVNALQAILAAKAHDIPVLMRAESWLGDRERSGIKLAAKDLLMRTLRNYVAATLPIGSVNAAYWRHYFGDDFPQFLMPYAIDNEAFAARAAAADPSRLRAELNIDDDHPVILFASKLQPRKNAADLVEACRALLTQLPPERTPWLVIAGDGEERAALEARCRERQLTRVRFAGFRNQTELPAFFAMSDVFVLPSRHEPWGLVVNEAMASGCAVIVSTDCGCAADLVTPGVEGFTFAPGDVPALTTALRSMLASPETAARMGDAARRRMRTWSFEEDVRGLREALAFTTRRLRA